MNVITMHSKTSNIIKKKKSKRDFEPNMKSLVRIIDNKLAKTDINKILILPVIIWNKNRFLKWTDFKKKSDSNSNWSSNSAIGFESTPFIEHIKTGGRFKFKIRDMQLHAIFIPDLSWMIKNISKKNRRLLLKHEQGHFDLAEEITRKTRTKTNNRFQNRTLTSKGKNKNMAKKDAIFQTSKIRKKISGKLQKQLNNQETKYDDKTNHGLIKRHQDTYNKRFRKLRE
jgi:hypothetical protein